MICPICGGGWPDDEPVSEPRVLVVFKTAGAGSC